ncbi:MAG: hypothetical protein HC802_18400 [Caldilineaceae bacterium]|nr:hypothetical protein [Caldilineaceae bacterium]
MVILLVSLLATGCAAPDLDRTRVRELSAAVYFDKVWGAWQATMVANHTGLLHEGRYLEAPSPADSLELALLDQWSTDDDTAVEWVDLHILESHGLEPTYSQIRDEWVDHLNHDIWVSTLRARDIDGRGVCCHRRRAAPNATPTESGPLTPSYRPNCLG